MNDKLGFTQGKRILFEPTLNLGLNGVGRLIKVLSGSSIALSESANQCEYASSERNAE